MHSSSAHSGYVVVGDEVEIAHYSSFDDSEHIDIPAEIEGKISNWAFRFCSQLEAAYFTGNAPSTFGNSVFPNTHPDFTIHYLSTATGLTSPNTSLRLRVE